jgi:hypothetical protein
MIFRELRAETGRTLSLLHALRFLLATNPAALTQVLGVVYRTMARHLIPRPVDTTDRSRSARQW